MRDLNCGNGIRVLSQKISWKSQRFFIRDSNHPGMYLFLPKHQAGYDNTSRWQFFFLCCHLLKLSVSILG